jgi:murein DD-endopeptidase MepM/ murein hydrolase activator NlpD
VIRLVAGGTVAVVASGAIAGATGTIAASHQVLSPPVAPTTQGVSVDDAADHWALLHAPAGAPILAVSAGRLTRVDATHVRVQGDGDDAGLDVDYVLAASAETPADVQRGDAVGAAPAAPAVARIHAILDGRALDTATLLRASLQSGGGDVADGWMRPVEGAWISQPFGCTPYAMEPVDRSCPSGHVHTGIDLAVPLGTPVRAALDGVAHVVVSLTGYGLHVILDHGDGLTTLYAHLSAVTVADGDAVAAGDVIGLAGSSGNSTGPHLHFEVRRDGIAEDPTLDVALP